MKTTSTFSLTCLALLMGGAPAAQADIFGSGSNTFDMAFTTIGNPGNADDTTGTPNPAGAVAYTYRMGVNEVSRDMVTKANALSNLGIPLADMTSLGSNGVNRPATGVTWNNSARFVNWLNTSQGHQAAYKFAVQPGEGGYSSFANIELWVSGDTGFDATNPFRNSLAHYFLPSMDEWYKAAYYDPNANAGAGGYWDYPTGSDTAPTAVTGGTAAGTAVYDQTAGPADITQAGGLSPYGTMGQGGNVFEWEETELDLVNDSSSSDRALRGGAWYRNSSFLSVSTRFSASPGLSRPYIGFRVASVPEPHALTLAITAMLGLLWKRRRRHR